MIAVTMGDPAGIGPEIIIKSLAEGALSGAPVVVVGCAQTLRRILALNITPRAELRIIDHPAEASFSPATINVIDEPLSDPQGLRPGEVQAQAGDLAFRCIRRATALALDGAVAAIATAPLNKEALHLAGHAFPGHTELLAHLTQTTDYAMVLYTEKPQGYPYHHPYRPAPVPRYPQPAANRDGDWRSGSVFAPGRLSASAHSGCRR